jgi:hypothetical protein
MKNDYIFMELMTDSGEGLTAFEENGKYYMCIQNNKKEISEEFFKAIQKEFKPVEDEDEKLYKGIINQSMKEVWDNEKDSIYDNE